MFRAGRSDRLGLRPQYSWERRSLPRRNESTVWAMSRHRASLPDTYAV